MIYLDDLEERKTELCMWLSTLKGEAWKNALRELAKVKVEIKKAQAIAATAKKNVTNG